MDRSEDRLRSFGMSTLQINDDLKSLENRFGIELGHSGIGRGDASSYYPQFDEDVRLQAREMASHYELFYSLEQSIRAIIASTFFDSYGAGWWKKAVPGRIPEDVEGRMQRERDSGFSLRSDREIDYTNFGELSVIITSNWDVFGAIFSSKRAVERIMNSLNLLRGPIAHCSPLAEDEVDRLRLTVKDWFRSMS